MPGREVVQEGQRLMAICNACRYCEGFCAVFPAMEKRLTFAEADMHYLANLCHNCSECLHACQYSPPHPFEVNVPRTLAQIRVRTYEEYCWPRALGGAFRKNGVRTALGLALGFSAAIFAASTLIAHRPALVAGEHAQFYAVVSHDVIVAAFGTVCALVALSLAISLSRYVRATRSMPADLGSASDLGSGLRDILTLTYLHGSGADCTSEEETRRPWRRWFHHLTFYGFLLCTASTSVAAIYHSVFGWSAPYAYTSVPVLLGAAGGIGLIVGPVGLWWLRGRRDPASTDPDSAGLDTAFIVLLVLTSLTGLGLLAFRESAAMGLLLLVHFGAVLALFVTLPYGKFVHGLYRAAALLQYARESRVIPTVGSSA